MAEIWGIVLAAGESKRMNFPKMLLPVNGKTMIETVLETILLSRIRKIVVVTGAYREEINKVAGKLPVSMCHNENYKNGMLSSVLCAVSSIPDEEGQVLVFPGDKPFITTEVINLLIDSYNTGKKGIVVPVFMKKRGHPVLIDLRYRKKVEALDPSEGLKSLARLFPDDVLEVETNNPGILRDIDTYDDYVRSLNQTP